MNSRSSKLGNQIIYLSLITFEYVYNENNFQLALVNVLKQNCYQGSNSFKVEINQFSPHLESQIFIPKQNSVLFLRINTFFFTSQSEITSKTAEDSYQSLSDLIFNLCYNPSKSTELKKNCRFCFLSFVSYFLFPLFKVVQWNYKRLKVLVLQAVVEAR